MSGIEVKSTGSPDETRPFTDKGKAHVVRVKDETVLLGVFEPGWRWSEHVKPLAGTDSCQSRHAIYCVSGQMHIVMDDGTEADLGPGDVMVIEPGHDAWTVGDEPCVSVDWSAAATYAKPS
jgi:quercetin dioxygenase-like cupin family protein